MGSYGEACRSLSRYLVPAWAENLCEIPTAEAQVNRVKYTDYVSLYCLYFPRSPSHTFVPYNTRFQARLSRLEIDHMGAYVKLLSL